MFIYDLFENAETMNTVVVYPGRFQPWHRGHHEVYNYLVRNFGRDRVFIATSNKVAPPRSPFSFGEKLQFMNFTGIPGDVVIETTDPYRVPELVNKLDGNNTRLIFAVSEKDMQEDPRFKFGTKKDGSPTYFQPMPRDGSQMQPLTHHAYIMVVPTFEFKVLGKVVKSATDIRALFAGGDDQTQKQIIVDLFGKYSPEIHALMKSKIALTEALKPSSLMSLQTAKQQIAQKTKDEVSAWEQDFLKNVAAKRGVGTSQPVAQPAPTAPQPTEKHSVLKNRLANLDIAIAKQQQLDLLRAKAEARGLLNPGLEADTDTSLYIKDAAKDNYQSLIQKIDSSIQAIKSRMNMKRLAYKESNFEQLAESQILDLTKNFPNHAQVHAQVVDVLPSGKVKLQIVKADPITGKKPTLAVGQKLSMALNYLRNVQPVGDVAEGKVIPANFGTGKYYKNPDIEIPMYDPVLERKWDPAYSGGNPQESFYKFEVQPASQTASHIVGVYNGKRIRISTAPNELANALVDAYNRGGFTDKHIEKVPLSEEDPEWSRPPGASSAQTRQVMNKMNPANNKFIWKRPNQIGGSFADQDLLAQGFKKSQYGSWGGTQAMWNRLLGIKENNTLNQPTPTLRNLIKKYPNVPQDKLLSQLKLGVKTEFEHTKDAKSAMEIALDHLNEKPDYYTLLHRAGLE